MCENLYLQEEHLREVGQRPAPLWDRDQRSVVHSQSGG